MILTEYINSTQVHSSWLFLSNYSSVYLIISIKNINFALKCMVYSIPDTYQVMISKVLCLLFYFIIVHLLVTWSEHKINYSTLNVCWVLDLLVKLEFSQHLENSMIRALSVAEVKVSKDDSMPIQIDQF